ncbi:MAG: prolyl oligopeptidase family serine peptidase, partial [bacterium]|nr:prolyl oligopeptidase family serine peptidase [bacterium]
LQMQQVDSKLLLFPDEGHWINKPQNSILWYEEFLGWVDRYLQAPEETPNPFKEQPVSSDAGDLGPSSPDVPDR